MELDDEKMQLNDVKSIKQIWEAAKKGGPINSNKGPQYPYEFENGERVVFSWVVSVFIEEDSNWEGYYATNFKNIISVIKAMHANGQVYLFTDPHV